MTAVASAGAVGANARPMPRRLLRNWRCCRDGARDPHLGPQSTLGPVRKPQASSCTGQHQIDDCQAKAASDRCLVAAPEEALPDLWEFVFWNARTIVVEDDRNAAATSLIRDAGYEAITYAAEMVRPSVHDFPDHRLPEGLELRPVREEDIRTIWEADVEAFRDHWGFVEQTEADYQRFLAYPYLDTSLWKIAWDDQGVAGQVKSFIDTAQNEENGRRRGWTESISTARRWRRRGVAKALIVESICELASRGMTEVALGVHTENPNGAYDLYSGLGYEVVATWTTYRKPL